MTLAELRQEMAVLAVKAADSGISMLCTVADFDHEIDGMVPGFMLCPPDRPKTERLLNGIALRAADLLGCVDEAEKIRFERLLGGDLHV